MAPGQYDIQSMIQRIFGFSAMLVVAAGLIASDVLAPPASAQVLMPGNPMLTPPPPPSPPPPRIEVPVVPKLDAMPSQPTAPLSRRSFGDRITDCLQDGAAAGLDPNDRAAYSRACANR